jgi:hypothetical protein
MVAVYCLKTLRRYITTSTSRSIYTGEVTFELSGILYLKIYIAASKTRCIFKNYLSYLNAQNERDKDREEGGKKGRDGQIKKERKNDVIFNGKKKVSTFFVLSTRVFSLSS